MCKISMGWMELPSEGSAERVRDGQWEEVKAKSFTPIACLLDGRYDRHACIKKDATLETGH